MFEWIIAAGIASVVVMLFFTVFYKWISKK